MVAIDNIHKPMKEEIFDALHRDIIVGKYAAGEWLRQEDIASQIGVSMTPVREALDLLVAAGLAERVPYRGVRVPEPSSQEIVEAYGLRIVLEATAARGAAMNITQDQLAALSETLDELRNQDTLNELSNARQLSRQFHLSVVEASGNHLLVKLYNIVANAFPDWMLYEAMSHHPEMLAKSFADEEKEHRAIVKALEKGDGEKAAQRAVEHVLNLGKGMVKFLNIPAELLKQKEQEISHIIKKAK